MRKLPKSRAANLIGGALAIAGAVGVTLALVKRVQDGRGIDHYVAQSGQEWSAVPALVATVVVLGVWIAFVAVRWYAKRVNRNGLVASIWGEHRRRPARRPSRSGAKQ